jgi:hypothetical protein
MPQNSSYSDRAALAVECFLGWAAAILISQGLRRPLLYESLAPITRCLRGTSLLHADLNLVPTLSDLHAMRICSSLFAALYYYLRGTVHGRFMLRWELNRWHRLLPDSVLAAYGVDELNGSLYLAVSLGCTRCVHLLYCATQE